MDCNAVIEHLRKKDYDLSLRDIETLIELFYLIKLGEKPNFTQKSILPVLDYFGVKYKQMEIGWRIV